MIMHRPEQIWDSCMHLLWPFGRWQMGLAALRMVLLAASVRVDYVLAQDLNLTPTRPTIANSATIQGKGVLQVEAGYDAYPGEQLTVGTLLSYAPLKRLRLDFGWSAFSHEEQGEESSSGIGTVQVGGKVVLREEKFNHAAPGVAIQYEAELPTASMPSLEGFGQQITLLVNHHYGRNGILDVMLNGSLVQSDCQTREGCRYGGQQSFALSYHLQERTRLYVEVFGQNNSQSNTPPGIYCFGGIFHKFSDSFGIDGGLRFGVTKQAPEVGATIGVVVGRRLRTGSPRKPQPKAGTSHYSGHLPVMFISNSGIGHVLAPWPFLIFGMPMIAG